MTSFYLDYLNYGHARRHWRLDFDTHLGGLSLALTGHLQVLLPRIPTRWLQGFLRVMPSP